MLFTSPAPLYPRKPFPREDWGGDKVEDQLSKDDERINAGLSIAKKGLFNQPRVVVWKVILLRQKCF